MRVCVRFKCLYEVEHKRTVRYRTNMYYKEQNIITNLIVQHRTKMFYLASRYHETWYDLEQNESCTYVHDVEPESSTLIKLA